MLNKLLRWFLGLVGAVVLLYIAIANRHGVRLNLDAFNPENPAIAIDALPFYAYLLAMLIAGVLLGGCATWLGQGKHRRTAAVRTQEAMRARAEAERLIREREALVASGQLAGHGMSRTGGRQLALSSNSRTARAK